MKYLDDMNRALDYIEANLHEKTDYEQIAKVACCSVYHLQRMFTFMTDLTLSEYIRRRKMTLAASDLARSDKKIIDIALDYGYESAESFTRAFKTLHQITPSQARTLGTSIKAFPRITFQILLKGVNSMKYKIVEKKSFQVYGKEIIVDGKDGLDGKEIPEYWLKVLQNGEYDKLMSSAGYPTVVNAVCCYRKLEGTKYPYMLCVVKTPLSDTTGYTEVTIPEATWAVFENEPHDISETSKALEELTSRVYTEWLPTVDYELVEGCNFEMYYSYQGKFYEERWFMIR